MYIRIEIGRFKLELGDSRSGEDRRQEDRTVGQERRSGTGRRIREDSPQKDGGEE